MSWRRLCFVSIHFWSTITWTKPYSAEMSNIFSRFRHQRFHPEKIDFDCLKPCDSTNRLPLLAKSLKYRFTDTADLEVFKKITSININICEKKHVFFLRFAALLYSFPCHSVEDFDLGEDTITLSHGSFIQMEESGTSLANSILDPSMVASSHDPPSQAAMFPPNLIANAFPAFISALAHITSSIAKILSPLASFLLDISFHLQRLGETVFAALLVLSILQALVALYQYRYDVRGQLIFPTGLTLGSEDYFSSNSHFSLKDIERVSEGDGAEEPIQSSVSSAKRNETCSNEFKEKFPATYVQSSGETFSSRVLKKINKSMLVLFPFISRKIHIVLTRNTHLFHIGFIVTLVSLLGDILKVGHLDDESKDGNVGRVGTDFRSKNTSWNIDLKKIFGDKVNTVIDRNSGAESLQTTQTVGKRTIARTPSIVKKLASNKIQDPIRILVIGDSLAVGIGCIDIFDNEKNQSVPMTLVEKTSLDDDDDDERNRRGNKTASSHSPKQGPVFPQILARTLSYNLKQPVHWRSAGVDGGDVNDIRNFCMDVLKKECVQDPEEIKKLPSSYNSGPPDVIVCLFGMNDLKKLLSVNPLKLFKPGNDKNKGIGHGFRGGMESLLSEIYKYAPDAYVIFPALPIQTFHKNSIINIVPLGLLVDSVMVFWEGQKKRETETWHRKGRHAMYTDLTAKEIAGWYNNANQNDAEGENTAADRKDNDKQDPCFSAEYDNIEDEDMLLSADGVHPNKRMYAKWAESVGKKFLERMHSELEDETFDVRSEVNKRLSKNVSGKKFLPKQSQAKQKSKSKASY